MLAPNINLYMNNANSLMRDIAEQEVQTSCWRWYRLIIPCHRFWRACSDQSFSQLSCTSQSLMHWSQKSHLTRCAVQNLTRQIYSSDIFHASGRRLCLLIIHIRWVMTFKLSGKISLLLNSIRGLEKVTEPTPRKMRMKGRYSKLGAQMNSGNYLCV